MDRLRSPGGCPWDARADARVAGALPRSRRRTRRSRRSSPATAPTWPRSSATCCCRSSSTPASPRSTRSAPFGIDDVAGGIVEKLVRRHPHVFADVDADTAAEVAANWEHDQGRREGRAARRLLDGIPAGLPALARADKAASRLQRAGLSALAEQAADGAAVGARLMALVLEARGRGEDPEAALRAVVRALEQAAAGAGR